MKFNPTPGDWIYAENHIEGNHTQYTILANGSSVVADVMRRNFADVGKSKFNGEGTDRLHECPESFANARLMAASKRLYERLINSTAVSIGLKKHFSMQMSQEASDLLQSLIDGNMKLLDEVRDGET